MREKLYAELVNEIMTSEDSELLKCKVFMLLDKYEITERTTELVVSGYDHTEETVRMFMISKSVAGMQASTVKAYSETLKRFFTDTGKSFDDITTEDIRIYLAKAKIGGATASYIKTVRAYLSSFFTWCVKENRIPVNPVDRVESVKVPKRIKKTVSDEDFDIMLSNAKCVRDRIILLVLRYTGLRAEELCTMRVDNVDFKTGTISIIGKGNKERLVYFPKSVSAEMQTYVKTLTGEYMFPSVKSDHISKRRLAEIIDDASSDLELHVHPHMLRRTFATSELSIGNSIENVQKMLGHESISTTTIYCNVENERVRDTYNTLHS